MRHLRPVPTVPGGSRPLVVTGDPAVLDAVTRLAATAGVEVDVVPDLREARPRWGSAPLVVVGDDAARPVRRRLPRRDAVVLVGASQADPDVWMRGLELGAEHVVFLPDAESWLVARLTDAAHRHAAAAPLVAVVGGCGGAGASVLAAALAVTAARHGRSPLLVDTDACGGGLDLAFGGEAEPGLRWDELTHARGRLRGDALARALPRLHDVAVLTWDRGSTAAVSTETALAVVQAARRGAGLVVADLPRSALDLSPALLAEASIGLLVVPASVRAAAAASRAVAALGDVGNLRVVVRLPAPGGLRPDEVADALGLPLFGALPPERRLDEDLERGLPPARSGRGPLADVCRQVLDELVAVPVAA